MRAIIVDIDGTLALKGHRSPFDWMRVGEDSVNEPIKWLVRSFKPNVAIIIFSGRDSICRDITEKWLGENGIPWNALYMRPEGDMRKDSIVKKELYDQYVKDNYEVIFVLDDRNQVVDMWRNELGLTCLQVAKGDF